MQKEKKYEFWTDKIAREIVERKKFHFTDDRVPRMKKFVVKTSASLSGVLHIGRLSDTIRGESVFRSLKDLGVRAELIWVAEDMDPLRSIPKGMPENYVKYIGMPVTDVPDSFGCHKSYAEHHVSEYLKVIDQFVSTKMKKFSMRKEYKKGNFKKYIKILLDNIEKNKEIQNKYRTTKLPKEWCPWTPVCDNCGKIITPRIKKFEEGKVFYKCEDYEFERFVAKGCGHEGVNNPVSGNGKLMWKSEWAAQWARWNVCSEGAGKEYQVPGSAFWVNGEIAEKILKFPTPIPIFYEHLMIDGKKMSASLGNVVYPSDWLRVANPELLRLLFLKDPMRVRDLKWADIPKMMDEYDMLEKVYYGRKKVANERDRINFSRLFEMIQIKPLSNTYEPNVPFNVLFEIVKISPERNQLKFVLNKLKELGHLKEITPGLKIKIENRLNYAKNWYEKFEKKLEEKVKISHKEKNAIKDLIRTIKSETDRESLQTKIFEIARLNGIKPSEFFRLIYQILLKSERGPRLGPYIIERGKKEVIKKLKEVI
ncbi:MAG: lysine--tRNA ligase [Candidatus Aenigmarchaeota archaeon]|nr:lysine--tRNA ligase [Candidatus Aenigmarchaeota archaeon]